MITRLVVNSESFLPTRDSLGISNSSVVVSPAYSANSRFFANAFFAFLYNFAIRVSRIRRITLITLEVLVPALLAFPAL